MIEKTSGCKNCESDYYCDLIMGNMTEGCPCKDCLIKPVCKISCEEFDIYYSSRMGFKPSSNKGY